MSFCDRQARPPGVVDEALSWVAGRPPGCEGVEHVTRLANLVDRLVEVARELLDAEEENRWREASDARAGRLAAARRALVETLETCR